MKLPGPAILRMHLFSGMNKDQIAERYGVGRGSVTAALVKHKLEKLPITRSEAPPPRVTRHPVRDTISVEADRIVIIRQTVAGENGGISYRSMSLPRVSMHIASLQERGLS